MSNTRTANLINFFVLALLPIYMGVHAYLLPQTLSVSGIADAGFISVITLTFLACAFVNILKLTFNTRLAYSKWTAIAAAYVVLIYFLREADFHRLFTVEHVTRVAFYTMPSVPLWQRIFSALVFVLLAGSIVYLLFNYVRLIWHKLRAFEPWTVSLLLWFIVLFVSQLCDQSGLNDLHVGRVIEECSECWAAIFVFLVTVQIIPSLELRVSRSQETNQQDEIRS